MDAAATSASFALGGDGLHCSGPLLFRTPDVVDSLLGSASFGDGWFEQRKKNQLKFTFTVQSSSGLVLPMPLPMKAG
jgi:hypothetical protein